MSHYARGRSSSSLDWHFLHFRLSHPVVAFSPVSSLYEGLLAVLHLGDGGVTLDEKFVA